MVTADQVQVLLQPLNLALAPSQTEQLLVYLDLLATWNRKINLTSIRSEEECVTRHFGESLYLARWASLAGRLLDVGSGAGFPGLALKIVFPGLRVTLLEPVAKKRAFLKEVARTCRMDGVDVRPDRLDAFAGAAVASRWADEVFDCATARAVGDLEGLTNRMSELLKPGGAVYLWITRRRANGIAPGHARLEWQEPIPIPQGGERIIWWGIRR